MKPSAITATLLAVTMVPAMATAPKEYRLQVRILHAHWHTNRHYYTRGEGYGDLFVPEKGEVGFDYVFEGCEPFEPTRGDERAPARWKQEPHRLIVEMAEVGSDKSHECELKVTLKDFRYVVHNGHVTTEPIDAQPEQAAPPPSQP